MHKKGGNGNNMAASRGSGNYERLGKDFKEDDALYVFWGRG
jgi:hypothetical protein